MYAFQYLAEKGSWPLLVEQIFLLEALDNKTKYFGPFIYLLRSRIRELQETFARPETDIVTP